MCDSAVLSFVENLTEKGTNVYDVRFQRANAAGVSFVEILTEKGTGMYDVPSEGKRPAGVASLSLLDVPWSALARVGPCFAPCGRVN